MTTALDAGATRVYCRGVDLSTRLQLTTLTKQKEEVDVTAYTDTIRNMLPTLGTVSLAHAGIYEEGANTIGEAFRQAEATESEPITIFPKGATLGEKAFLVLAHRADVTVMDGAAPGAVHKISLAAKSNAHLGEGVVAYSGTVGSDSQTAGYQLGAIPAGSVVRASIHLIGISSTPAAVFYLESDDNNSFTSATIQATSASQAARGVVLLEKAGAIADDYFRVRWDWTTPGSFTAVIALTVAKL